MDFIEQIFKVLPFLASLFWTIYLGVNIRNRDNAQKMLFLFMLVETGMFLCHAIYYNSALCTHFTAWDLLYYLCSTSVYPAYYLYVIRLTDGMKLTFKQIFLMWAPPMCMFLFVLVGYVYGWTRSKGEFLAAVIRVSQLVVVGILSFKRLYVYDMKIRNFYSSIDDKTVKSTMVISILYFIASVCSVILSVLGREWFIGSCILCVPSFVFTILTIAFGYIGSKYKFKVEQFDSDASGDGVESDIQDEHLFLSIENNMADKQLFLQQGFNINELAAAVGSNRTYVSETINAHFGRTFSDYVNHYRVEYAKNLLQAGAYTIGDIAAKAGFSSIESFRRNFRNETGLSPSQWKNDD